MRESCSPTNILINLCHVQTRYQTHSSYFYYFDENQGYLLLKVVFMWQMMDRNPVIENYKCCVSTSRLPNSDTILRNTFRISSPVHPSAGLCGVSCALDCCF